MNKLNAAELSSILLPTQAQLERLQMSQTLRSARPKPEVLVVDVSAPRRQLLQDMLNTNIFPQGCKFYTASTLQEAWSRYLSYAPDMVFIDKDLADFNGYRLARIIHAVDKHAFVAIVAEQPTHDDADDIRSSGVKGLLIKPYDVQRVQAISQPMILKFAARKKVKK